MQQRTQVCRILIGLMAVLLLGSGCRQKAQNTPAAPPISAASVATSAAPISPGTAPATDFQPYVLLPQPAPKPAVVTHRHRVLHLARRSGHVYLADTGGHYYQVGRDRQGHIYPIYRDTATHAVYPLFYDHDRDRLYRVVRNDDGHFYRGYIDDPTDRFYADDRDYRYVTPSDSDRPIITDSYNTTYNTYNNPVHTAYIRGGRYYPPPAHHTSHNTSWLWAIPIVVGAYLLLRPHHHSFIPPPRSVAPVTVIVQQRQTNPVTIINGHPVASYVRRPTYAPVLLNHSVKAPTSVRPLAPARVPAARLAPSPRLAAIVHPAATLRKPVPVVAIVRPRFHPVVHPVRVVGRARPFHALLSARPVWHPHSVQAVHTPPHPRKETHRTFFPARPVRPVPSPVVIKASPLPPRITARRAAAPLHPVLPHRPSPLLHTAIRPIPMIAAHHQALRPVPREEAPRLSVRPTPHRRPAPKFKALYPSAHRAAPIKHDDRPQPQRR